MYTSKYAIPLEINASSSRMHKSAKDQASDSAYPWSDFIIAALHLLWSIMLGILYFIAAIWKNNPWLNNLPWLRLSILAIVALALYGPSVSSTNPSPKPNQAIGLLATDDLGDRPSPEPTKQSSAKANPTVAPKKLEDRSVAPAAPEKLQKTDVQDFIKRFTPTAKAEMELYGIPASIKMGQAIIESQSGNSVLARESKNFFGIKCKSKCLSCTCRNYADDDPYDMFRVFDSAWESWRAHSKLLCNPRYAKLPLYKKDYKKWAKGLKAAGYATDPKYAEKLIAVIEKYNLTNLDR